MVAVENDGNCLFRAVAVCLWNSEDRHLELRRQVADRMVSMQKDIAPFLDSMTVQKYTNLLRKSKYWAGHLELSVIQIMFNRRIRIIDADTLIAHKIELGTGDFEETGEEIHLVYHGKSHYNAAVKKKVENSNMTLSTKLKSMRGSVGIIIFGDAASVSRLLDRQPLYILDRQVRLSATPWPDLPVIAELHSTELSRPLSDNETHISDVHEISRNILESIESEGDPNFSKRSEPKASRLHEIPSVGSNEPPKEARLQRPLQLAFKAKRARPNSFISWLLADRWRAVASFATVLLALETVLFLWWWWRYDNSSEIASLEQRIEKLAAAVDKMDEQTCTSTESQL